jgi:hypothetical protein
MAALHGLTRALAANAVQGVSTGFTRELDIVGIGYRADVKGKIATFTLGYSHPIEVLLPEGVDLKIDKQTHLVLTGYDKQLVGQVAANIRALRPPDPYKNKGVRYTGEVLRKKVGKTGAERERSKWQNLPRNEIRQRIHTRIRRKLKGTPERPRLAVFRSVKHIYAQVIDDAQGTRWWPRLGRKEFGARAAAIWPAPKKSASWSPSAPRKRASSKVVFDRGGYLITAA